MYAYLRPTALGGWGTHGPSHAGKRCLLDVLAAVTHTLCDVYQHIYTRLDAGLFVNLHFDYEDAFTKVVAKRTSAAKVSLVAKAPDNIFIRLPKWTPIDSVRLEVDGNSVPVKLMGTLVWISKGLLREGVKSSCITRFLSGFQTRRCRPAKCTTSNGGATKSLGSGPMMTPCHFIRHCKTGKVKC